MSDDHCWAQCPNCASELSVPAELAGKKVNCKKCKHSFRLPEIEDNEEEETANADNKVTVMAIAVACGIIGAALGLFTAYKIGYGFIHCTLWGGVISAGASGAIVRSILKVKDKKR